MTKKNRRKFVKEEEKKERETEKKRKERTLWVNKMMQFFLGGDGEGGVHFLSVIIDSDTCSCRVVKSLLFDHFLYPRCNLARGQLCPTSKRGEAARIYYCKSLKQTIHTQITSTMQIFYCM